MFLGAGFQRTFLTHKPFTIAKHKMYVPEGNLFAFCFEENEFNELVKLYSKQLMKTNLPSYAKRFEAEFLYFLNFAKKFSVQNFSKMSNQQLAKVVKELDDKIVDFYEYQFYAFLVLEGIGKVRYFFFQAELEKKNKGSYLRKKSAKIAASCES